MTPVRLPPTRTLITVVVLVTGGTAFGSTAPPRVDGLPVATTDGDAEAVGVESALGLALALGLGDSDGSAPADFVGSALGASDAFAEAVGVASAGLAAAADSDGVGVGVAEALFGTTPTLSPITSSARAAARILNPTDATRMRPLLPGEPPRTACRDWSRLTEAPAAATPIEHKVETC